MSLLQLFALRRRYFVLALVVLMLDQTTKILAHAYLSTRGQLTIVPDLFALTYSRNPGGLFGYFAQLGQPWRFVLLTALPLAAVGLIVAFLVSSGATDRLTRLALSLILGGALGNLIDRLVRGEVVDFLDVYIGGGRVADWLVTRFGTAHWPTFNVADSAIVVGACLLLLDMFRSRSAPAPETSRR